MSAIPGESVFCSAALASGLVTNEAIEYAERVARHRLSQAGQSGAELSDRLLAEILVEQEILTQYQAEQLMEGRTKLTLGPYIVTDFIAQGGMGQVYKAVHRFMGRVCAVKVLPLERATQLARDSFIRETRMQAKLDCPYLVRAFDAGVDGKVHYLVTEYVPGMDLRRLVKLRGPLSVQQAAHIIRQAALGLAYAHDKGLIHRDVKPGNILVTPQGDAKVSDVGLAGFNQDLLNDPRAGKIVGTTDYISPEQIRTPLEVKPVADIYSLGCTLYYTVCGKVPFPGGDTPSKLKRHLEETPWHPRRFVPDIPEDFVDIIADMMDKTPEKRIGTAKEVAARLEPWADVHHHELSTAKLSRSPCMAPPPPLDPDSESAGSVGEEAANQESSAASSHAANFGSASNLENLKLNAARERDQNSHSLSNPGSGVKPVPVVAPMDQMSPWMVVALTLAIAVPPTLVIGAIFGYLFSRGV
ncbi:MAG: serine/threonine protein kinase [Pirellulaceae bacterium]|nr:serine/threonine protein kinase [Pirellulaceae bacterium]